MAYPRRVYRAGRISGRHFSSISRLYIHTHIYRDIQTVNSYVPKSIAGDPAQWISRTCARWLSLESHALQFT